MFRSREVNAPELTCPRCTSTPKGEPGRWNHCPDCGDLWREPSSPVTAPAQTAAEKRYSQAERQAWRVWRRLQRRRNTPKDRWTMLANLASLADEMSIADLVWDNDRTDRDGFTPAEWEAGAARLLRLVMDTERALTLRDDHIPDPYRFATLDEDPLGSHKQVRDVLTRLNEATDLVERANLTTELHHAVISEVGEMAAERLARLAWAYRKSAQTGWRRFVPWL